MKARLFGRREELAQLAQRMRNERLVTILAVGGMGKTRLAAAMLAEHDAAGGAPGIFVDLTEADGEGALLDAIASALGAKTNAVGPALRSRGACLVVLDNFEQLVSAATVVSDLLEAAPEARFVVTSRELLHLGDEGIFELGPLDAAEGFLVDRMRARRPAWSPTAEDEALVAELVTALDGIPLAIELAAERAVLLGLRALVGAGVPHHLDAKGPREMPARHRTMTAAIDGSYGALDHDEREVLAACATFRGGFAAADVVAIASIGAGDAGDAGDAGRDVLGALERLRGKALLTDDEARPRLNLLSVIRQFVTERAPRELLDRLIDAHSARFMQLARSVRDPAWIAAEWENLEAVIDRALARGDGRTARELLAAVGESALRKGRLEMLSVRCARVLAADENADDMLVLRARIARRQGRIADAERDFDRALQIVRDRRDTAAEARMLRQKSLRLARAARLDEAIETFEAAEQLGAPSGSAYDVLGLSSALRQRGDRVRARIVVERYLLGSVDDRDRGLALLELSLAHLETSGFAAARAAATEALALFERLEWPSEAARAHLFVALSLIHAEGVDAEGRENAVTALHHAIASAESAGGSSAREYARGYLGILHFEGGRLEEAERELARVLPPDGGHVALFASYRSAIAASRGDLETARAFAHETVRDDVPPTLQIAIDVQAAHLALAEARGATSAAHAAAATDRAMSILAVQDVHGDSLLALRIARATLARHRGSSAPAIEVHERGDWFSVGDGPPADCTRHANARKALVVLARHRLEAPGASLDFDALAERIWQGESVLQKAARNRLRVTMAHLRKAGMRDLLLTDDTGYRISERSALRIVPMALRG